MKHILIFAGTTEGRELMEKIKHFQVEVFVSVATEYGKECLLKEPEKERTVSTKHGEVQAGNLNIIAGRMKEVEMKRYMEKQAIDLVVDATHPFAREVTKNIRTACREARISYLRLLRNPSEKDEGICYVSSVEEGVRFLDKTEGKILITTGSKELSTYTKIRDYQDRCYARVLSTKEAVEESVKLGFEGDHLIAMQGPYSEEMNTALLHHVQADFLITKESGNAGGFEEKVRAAVKTGTTLVVVERPEEEGESFEEVIERVRQWSLQ